MLLLIFFGQSRRGVRCCVIGSGGCGLHHSSVNRNLNVRRKLLFGKISMRIAVRHSEQRFVGGGVAACVLLDFL